MQRLMLVLCLGMLALAGCRQTVAVTPNPNIVIEVRIEDSVPAVGEDTLLVVVNDANGNPINNATLDIRGDMTHAGMSPIIRQAENGQAGMYVVPFEWSMAGDWIVDVVATLPDGSQGSARFEYLVIVE